jgi:hypothetical protein
LIRQHNMWVKEFELYVRFERQHRMGSPRRTRTPRRGASRGGTGRQASHS